MGHSPFAGRSGSRTEAANRRRSTRLDRVVPIVLSGRDATGQVFRERTETCTVNLHGAKIKTRQPILVGMPITVDNPTTGGAEKSICVLDSCFILAWKKCDWPFASPAPSGEGWPGSLPQTELVDGGLGVPPK